jgi:GSH-dependent disulfide-bond oxidoreductase
MASYPWIVPHERQGQDLNDFPNLKRWYDAIAARPATVRAYAVPDRFKDLPEASEEERRRNLFGAQPATV